MYCNICHNFFIKERHFNEILKRKKHIYFCDNCLNKIKIAYKLNVIPLDNRKRLFEINIFDFLPSDNLDYFSDIYSLVYFKLLKKKIGYIIIADYFKEEDIEIYSMVSTLLDSDIFVVSFLLKTLY